MRTRFSFCAPLLLITGCADLLGISDIPPVADASSGVTEDANDSGALGDSGSNDATPSFDAGGAEDAGRDSAIVDAGGGHSSTDAMPETGGANDASNGCFDGAIACDSGCADPSTDPNNCGACGSGCPTSLPYCSAGQCIPPSCVGGGEGAGFNCGVDGGNDNCCSSPLVSGHSFYRSYTITDAGELDDGSLAASATISSLRVDAYMVTVGRYRKFVNGTTLEDGGLSWTPAPGAGKHAHLNGGLGLVAANEDGGHEPGWSASDDTNLAPRSATTGLGVCASATWTEEVGANENLPISCVNWADAYAFCIWDGAFLPSSTEYEYVETGGDQERLYPWGSAEPGTDNAYAIFSASTDVCFYPAPNGGAGSACGETALNMAPVGTAQLGVGRYGQFDLTGELEERTLDWNGSGFPSPCSDCALVTPGTERSTHGADVSHTASFLDSEYRDGTIPTAIGYIGFRCARTP